MCLLLVSSFKSVQAQDQTDYSILGSTTALMASIYVFGYQWAAKSKEVIEGQSNDFRKKLMTKEDAIAREIKQFDKMIETYDDHIRKANTMAASDKARVLRYTKGQRKVYLEKRVQSIRELVSKSSISQSEFDRVFSPLEGDASKEYYKANTRNVHLDRVKIKIRNIRMHLDSKALKPSFKLTKLNQLKRLEGFASKCKRVPGANKLLIALTVGTAATAAAASLEESEIRNIESVSEECASVLDLNEDLSLNIHNENRDKSKDIVEIDSKESKNKQRSL